MEITFETRVCGGFPVQVRADVYWDSSNNAYTDGYEILTPKGKPAKFITSKMTRDDHEIIEEAALEFVNDMPG